MVVFGEFLLILVKFKWKATKIQIICCVTNINSLLNDKILDQTKLKALALDTKNVNRKKKNLFWEG